MGKATLKTGHRKTTINRKVVREAITGRFAESSFAKMAKAETSKAISSGNKVKGSVRNK